MYASLEEKYINNNRKKANKEAIEQMGEDAKSVLMFPNLTDEVDTFEFDEGRIHLGWSNEMGYFSMDYNLTDDEMFQIIEHMKNKGQKIKRLINLCGE